MQIHATQHECRDHILGLKGATVLHSNMLKNVEIILTIPLKLKVELKEKLGAGEEIGSIIQPM